MGVESEAGSNAKPITLRLYMVRGVEVILDRELASFEGLESECHVFLARWRMHGEWFEPSREVLAFIRERLPRTPRVN